MMVQSGSCVFLIKDLLKRIPSNKNVQKGVIKSSAGIHMFKVNNRTTRTRCGIGSKLIIKTPGRRLASL